MAEIIFHHKCIEDNGDIVEIKMFKVPKSEKQPEGISYSMVYICNGIRAIGYDNFEGHSEKGSSHHKHTFGKTVPYAFFDEWKAVEDFYLDVEKARQRCLK